MKFGHNSGNNSAAKRIIPAVAMFALSAVMLTSSTYAWFTMSKEVKMTGLSMSATANSGMEIALASVNGNGDIDKNSVGTAPLDTNEYSWKSSVVVGQYYKNIGQLRPASSTNGVDFFDATDASNDGQTASNFKKVTTKAGTLLQDTLSSDPNPDISSEGADEGYYVDIPVHLRTNKAGTGSDDIYCKIKIKNNDSVDPDKDLSKAVRVAFIPSAEDRSSTTKIFGVNDKYYSGDTANAVSSETDKSAVSVETAFVTQDNEFKNGDGVVSGLKIPFATGSATHGHLDFTVRVWLEGESRFCSDTTSGQAWNIDFAFSMGKFSSAESA